MARTPEEINYLRRHKGLAGLLGNDSLSKDDVIKAKYDIIPVLTSIEYEHAVRSGDPYWKQFSEKDYRHAAISRWRESQGLKGPVKRREISDKSIFGSIKALFQ
jgi:hypothetical protein